MAEVMDECTYVPHHVKKIVFVLSAMRHFAETLRQSGFKVDYIKLDDPDNPGSLQGALAVAKERWQPSKVIITEPGEWRLLDKMRGWETVIGVPVEIRDDDRFIASHSDFDQWAKGKKSLRMEYFYRLLRKKTDLLIDHVGDPVGGKWNFDAENRHALPKEIRPPEPLRTEPDAITRNVMTLVRERFSNHFGDLEPFWFAVTADGAAAAFQHFIENALPSFGDYQDAMKEGEFTLFHAVIGLYLNVGLLDPLKVCREVEAEYYADRIPLNAAEGFIRQIIGWREYTRGIYWLKMPAYAEWNFFAADRPLPDFYWSADTDMNCLRQCIGQTKSEAYAHHIQRLMVTGAFALMAGIDPKQVCEWYLCVYADAYEWVELPNTHGMALFADGGVLASKPYAASGKYINRMSDYCKSCRYDVNASHGENACPFNFLYWDFLARNRDRLEANPRVGMMYRTLDRFSENKVSAMRRQAAEFLSQC
jgi:deoxyribodipyrimidine photolyase-related protein